MNRIYRAVLILICTTGLMACSHDPLAKPEAMQEPVAVDQVLRTPAASCDTTETVVDDGIGGTGCAVE